MSSEAQRISQRYSLNTTQAAAVDAILERDSTLLVADKGAGKTRTALAVAHAGGGRVLVLCPNKVRGGWLAEGKKLGVPVVLVEGTAEARYALLSDQTLEILVMGVDLLPWLVDTFPEPPVQGLILDETTRFSSPGSVGVKKLRRWRGGLEWVLGMTAQPVMEDPLALYGQALVIDGGASLGRNFDMFKREYFYPTDWQQYNWDLLPGGGERLARAVGGLVYAMDDAAYRDSLVPMTEVVVPVTMPASAWRAYEDMAEALMMELGDGEEIEAANMAVVSGKLEQVVQGAAYVRGEPVWLHFAKFDALDALLEDMGDEPVIITYHFIYELEELRRRVPGGMDLKDVGALQALNDGRINRLFMHPRSGSHGINAQERCCEMICLKPVWSADAWDQVIGRIRRRGQTRPCRRRTLVVGGTVDELILDRVAGKGETGDSLLAHIRAASKHSA